MLVSVVPVLLGVQDRLQIQLHLTHVDAAARNADAEAHVDVSVAESARGLELVVDPEDLGSIPRGWRAIENKYASIFLNVFVGFCCFSDGIRTRMFTSCP